MWEKHNATCAYMNSVLESVRSKIARKQIKDEIGEHLDDNIQMHLSKGMNEEQAAQKAALDMGDPIIVGKELNKIHRPIIDLGLICSVVLLIIMGFLTLYAAGHTDKASSMIQYVPIYILVFIGSILIPWRKTQSHIKVIEWITIVSFILTTVTLFASVLFTVWENNLLQQGITSIEYPILRSLVFARYSRMQHLAYVTIFLSTFTLILNRKETRKTAIGCCLLSVLLIALCMYTKEYMVSIAILFALTLFLIHNGKKKWLTAFLIVSIFVVYGSALYVEKMQMLFHSDVDGQIMQPWLNNPHILTENARLIGKGADFGQMSEFGSQFPWSLDIGYLFLSAVIYYYGWLVGILVIVAIVFLLWRLWCCVQKIPDVFGKQLAQMLFVFIAVPCIYHILMSIGLLPMISSAAFPLSAYSVAQNIVTLACIGIIIQLRKNPFYEDRTFSLI